MVRVIGRAILLGAGMLAMAPPVIQAQAKAAATPAVESEVTETGDDSAPVKKKKKGLFGKVKDVAGNKAVRTVAKTAACTMLPGGQMIAGAIDAADSKSAGEVAGDAAGTAAGAAAGGSGCMPGGLGETGAAAALGGQLPDIPGTPEEDVPAEGVGYGAVDGMPDEAQVANCMGLTAEEYAAFTDPTGGQARQPTKQEMKRQQQLSRKIDMGRYQQCMMGGGR